MPVNTRRTASLASVLALCLVGMLGGSAHASFHLMKIRALYKGGGSNAFVELQMTADGQNLVSGQPITVYNNGATASTYILNHNVANAQNQRTILIGDSGTSGSPDFVLSGLGTDLAISAGALCYSSVDCVSWGGFTNNAALPSPAGTPLSGLSSTMVSFRGIGAGCPTALDDADDTNNSAADFSFGIFQPRNNSVTPTEVPCATAPPVTVKKKCKKKKKHHSAVAAKKHKKCKKKHHKK